MSEEAPRSAELLLRFAREAGFSVAGVTRAVPLEPGPLDAWFAQGLHADMDWMAERRDDRLDPSRLLPGAQTVLAMGLGFGRRGPGEVAGYARGRDYHSILRDRLKSLRKRLRREWPEVDHYGSVDSNPVMEKVWAERAGLGFQGKHSLLISPTHGSQLLLSVLLLTCEVDAYAAPSLRQCGSCTLCIQACPTDAIPRPGVVDARRCLSFHSIENEGEVPEPLREGFAQGLFGCDACQTVCPWNQKRSLPDDPAFREREFASLDALAFAGLSESEHDRLIPGSALARPGWQLLRRNAVLTLGARRDARARPLLETLQHDPEPRVAEAAQWALSRLPAL